MPEPRDLAFLIGKGNGGCRPARETGPCKIKRAAALVMLQPPTPARELVTWIHAPLQPLMRSPLSRLQTPTAPRRAVGFFRSGCPLGHPLEPIARPTSDWPVLFCQPFQPSTHVKIKAMTLSVNAHFWCNCGNPAEKSLLVILSERELSVGTGLRPVQGGRSPPLLAPSTVLSCHPEAARAALVAVSATKDLLFALG